MADQTPDTKAAKRVPEIGTNVKVTNLGPGKVVLTTMGGGAIGNPGNPAAADPPTRQVTVASGQSFDVLVHAKQNIIVQELPE